MPSKKIKAVKKAAKRAYDVLRDGDEQAKRRYREKIREAKDSPYPYSKKEKKEIRQYGATKAEMREEYNTAKDEISQTVSDMGGFSKGGMLIKGLNMKRKPVKKAKDEMVTKWEQKWG